MTSGWLNRVVAALPASQRGNSPGGPAMAVGNGIPPLLRGPATVGSWAPSSFAELSPDLYARAGGPKNPDDMDQVRPVMFGLPDAQAVQDLEAAAGHLRGLPGATGKIGTIGFCSGGRHTLLFACSSSKVDAAIDCWGGFIHRATPDAEKTPERPTAVLDLVPQLHCPLFAVFGEEDQNPTVEQGEELRRRAQAAGKDVTVKVYPGAGHAFLADYRPSYRKDAAEDAWKRMTAWFKKYGVLS